MHEEHLPSFIKLCTIALHVDPYLHCICLHVGRSTCRIGLMYDRPHRSPAAARGFFFSSSWLIYQCIDEMKDLRCSSTVRLLST